MMEDLKDWGDVGKAWESLHSQASSLFQQVTLQLKDGEEHFRSNRKWLRTRFEELQTLEKQLEARELQLENGKSSLNSVLSMIKEKCEELSSIEKRLEEVERLIREKETEYDLMQNRIKEATKNLNRSKLAESEEAVQNSIGKFEKEIELKRRELKLIQKSMVECSNTLEVKETKIREYNNAFSLLKKSMEEWCCKLELKECEFEGCVSKLESKEKEVESKVEELHLIDKRVSDCLYDAQLKEKHVDSLEKSIQEGKHQLDAQQKSVQERENYLDLLQNSVEERAMLVDMLCRGHHRKEMELEQRANGLEFKERQVELKFDELNLKDKRVNERLNEVQLKEKHMDSLEKSIQEDKQHLDSLQKSVQESEKNLDSLSQELQRKEREVEQQAKELELQLKQINSQVKMEQLEPTPAVENALVPSSASNDSTINMDGISLQLVMNEQVERIDLAHNRMSAALQASSDPAKLVLDAMQGFYPSNPTENNREFESHLRVVRKSRILLLKELKRTSPLINPQVREEAMKLAADWKAEMTVAADNCLEILGFLWLITTYELTGICGSGELQGLLAMVALPEQTSELRRALGITDKAPGTNITSSIVKTERPESLLARHAATLSSSNNAIENDLLVTLQSSPDPAELALDMMKGALTRYWKNGNVSSRERAVKSSIFLLKFLMEHSVPVGPHLKEDATNLAAYWKPKWRAATEISLESLGFLLFIAIYGLLGTLRKDEIVMLLGRISQHTLSLELCETRGFVQYIPDFIQKLIKKKRVIEAVRCICTFKLIDKLLPVPLLQEYVEDAKKCSKVICSSPMTLDEKDKAVNGKIAHLRAVIQCIKEYDLESDYPSKTVEMQIVQLDLLKERCRSLAPSLVPKVEQQEERKRKRA